MTTSPSRLFLLRHAKASLAEAGESDESRPLSQRGITDATAMGKYMAKAALVPDKVLCSTARRTRETWNLVARELPTAPKAEFVQAAYDFGDGSRLLSLLREHGGTSSKLMLIGHNPAIGGLALSLAGSGNRKLRDKLVGKYPTGALAVISFESPEWSEISDGSGTLLNFIRPGDLSGN
jgi:phosphohistidine phosphatase